MLLLLCSSRTGNTSESLYERFTVEILYSRTARKTSTEAQCFPPIHEVLRTLYEQLRPLTTEQIRCRFAINYIVIASLASIFTL